MKLIIISFVFLFNTIKGDVNPFRVVPREQDISQNSFNELMPKTIIISGKNGQINTEDPNVMQAVMNAVNNQLNSDGYKGKDPNGNDIPQVIIADSEPQPSDQPMVSPLQTVQKVYNLPPMTRMIASEEETESKKSPLWRSPLPFMQPMDCVHHKHKKSRSSRRKGRKQHKVVKEVLPSPTVKPIVEETESPNLFNSVLSSMLSSGFSSGPEHEKQANDIRPLPLPMPLPGKSFLMSISHRIQPETPDLPIIQRPETRPRGFIAILHRRNEPAPLPLPLPLPFSRTFSPQLSEQSDSEMSGQPMLPLSPLLALLSKLEEPIEPNLSPNTDFKPKNVNQESVPNTAFNFNVNLTVNNYNYGQPETRGFPALGLPPFPIHFK